MNVCSNCGGAIQKEDVKCPYCGHMQYEAAEKAYMNELSDVLTDVDNLGDRGTKIFWKNTCKIMGIVLAVAVICILFGHVLAKNENADTNYYNEQYARKILERHDWYDRNHEKLQRIWETRDFAAVSELSGANDYYNRKGWSHDDIYSLWKQYVENGYETLQSRMTEGYLGESQFYFCVSYMIELVLEENGTNSSLSRLVKGLDAEEKALLEGWKAEAKLFLTETLHLTAEEMLTLQEVAKNNSLDYDERVEKYRPYYERLGEQ